MHSFVRHCWKIGSWHFLGVGVLERLLVSAVPKRSTVTTSLGSQYPSIRASTDQSMTRRSAKREITKTIRTTHVKGVEIQYSNRIMTDKMCDDRSVSNGCEENPCEFDVLLGRGKSNTHHPANQTFQGEFVVMKPQVFFRFGWMTRAEVSPSNLSNLLSQLLLR